MKGLLILVLTALVGVTPTFSNAQGPTPDAERIRQLEQDNAQLRVAIEDLKQQKEMGGIRLTHDRAGQMAFGGFVLTVMSVAANEWIRQEGASMAGQTAVRVLGIITTASVIVGGLATFIGGALYAFVPSPANANEFTNAFLSSPAGFNQILSEPTDVIMNWCRGEPALGQAILNLDRQVKAMQERN